MLKFSIIFDNYKFENNLTPMWGFSCLIEMDKQTILFDTGSNGRVLLKNAKKMGIDFKNIDMVFISHPHWDHIGGLDTILEENPNIELILPNSLSKYFIEDLKKLAKRVRIIDDEFSQIGHHLFSTGVMDNIEQSLIIQYNRETYIVTGCSHSGILKIQEKAQEHFRSKIKYIIGGFHLINKTPPEINSIIQKLKTEYITATHCTGDVAIGMLKVKFKEKFLGGGVGSVISF
jgi:7,8-dihydropterin-6-yl-methyl-4-(beta-D-ribofuranosyl)aminobenzene 5'-phosphate synthase